MINKLSLFVLLLLSVAGCQSGEGSAPDYSGTFARYTRDETGELWDTLRLSRLPGAPQRFQVIKSSRTIAIMDGKTLDPVVRRQMWTGEQSADNALRIIDIEDTYTLSPDGKALSNGKVSFTRVAR